MNLPGYVCSMCHRSDCSLVNGTNCQLHQFSQLRAEAERLRGALERIAAEPLACTCRVGDEADEVFADHYDTCVVSIARAALGGTNAK